MTRRAQGSGSWSFEDPREGVEDHELKWIAEIEYTTDTAPYGDTYVPVESSEVISATWELDGFEVAEWALDHKLRTMGLPLDRVNEIKMKTQQNWSSDD